MLDTHPAPTLTPIHGLDGCPHQGPDLVHRLYSRFTFAFVGRYRADYRRVVGVVARARMTSLDAGLDISQALINIWNAPQSGDPSVANIWQSINSCLGRSLNSPILHSQYYPMFSF